MSNPLWQNFFFKKEETTTLALLRRIPIFAEIDRKDLKLIQRYLHRRNYAPEEQIFNQGEPGNGMYIVASGSVEIYVGEEERTIFATLSEGHFLGELALLDNSPRSAHAKAKGETSLLGFFKPDLFELIEKKPTLGSQILLNLGGVLAERLRKTNEQLSTLQNREAQGE